MSTFVIVTDGTAIASVTITVNDVNEAPSFTLSLYSGEISENSAHGVDIITITAVDPTVKYSYGAQLVGLVVLSVTTAIRMHTLWQVYCK